MTAFDRELLGKLLELERAHAASAPPDRPYAMGGERTRFLGQRADWFERAEHGPRVAQLYNDGYNDAARKRTIRALLRLSDAGLVELWGAGQNITHAKLTPKGREAVQ